MTSRYEDELWSELVARQGEPPEEEHPPAPPWRPRGPWAAVGGLALLAAAATGAVLAYSAISAPTPAYAVTRNDDGSVKVWLRQTSGIKGLNARLKAMNVRAQAVLVAGGCPASQALAAAALHARGNVNWSARDRAVVRPPRTPARMHILLVRRGAHGTVSLSDVVGRAPVGVQVPACVGQVPVNVEGHGGLPRAVVVRPLNLQGPATCMGPRAGGSGSSTTGATTTTGQTATTGATATTGQTATTGATGTTGATTTGTSTTGTNRRLPLAVVRCCAELAKRGGTTTATSSGTSTATGTTSSSGTTTTSGATDTVTTTAPPAPPPGARCQLVRPRVQQVPVGTLTGGTSTATTTTTTSRSQTATTTH